MARRDPNSQLVLHFEGAAAGAAAPGRADGLADALAADTERLRNVALRITHDAAAAADVVQSALEKALRNRAAFRGEAKPSTWLHRIVVNEALMWLRSESRRRALSARFREAAGFDLPEPSSQPLDALLARERRESVQRALLSLQPEDLALIRHCALEGHGYASWALETGMHATAAKMRAFRARRTLRAALGRES